jgi:hypothetical protein
METALVPVAGTSLPESWRRHPRRTHTGRDWNRGYERTAGTHALACHGPTAICLRSLFTAARFVSPVARRLCTPACGRVRPRLVGGRRDRGRGWPTVQAGESGPGASADRSIFGAHAGRLYAPRPSLPRHCCREPHPRHPFRVGRNGPCAVLPPDRYLGCITSLSRYHGRRTVARQPVVRPSSTGLPVWLAGSVTGRRPVHSTVQCTRHRSRTGQKPPGNGLNPHQPALFAESCPS